MKITLKQRINGKWQYVPIQEVAGIPMSEVLTKQLGNFEAAIKVETDRGTTIITDNMVTHIAACNKKWQTMCLATGIPKLIKALGDKATIVPEEVAELWPDAVFVGINHTEEGYNPCLPISS